jgi:hypothetical protein
MAEGENKAFNLNTWTLTKKPPSWYLGLATTLGWVFFFLDAFYLFY